MGLVPQYRFAKGVKPALVIAAGIDPIFSPAFVGGWWWFSPFPLAERSDWADLRGKWPDLQFFLANQETIKTVRQVTNPPGELLSIIL